MRSASATAVVPSIGAASAPPSGSSYGDGRSHANAMVLLGGGRHAAVEGRLDQRHLAVHVELGETSARDVEPRTLPERVETVGNRSTGTIILGTSSCSSAVRSACARATRAGERSAVAAACRPSIPTLRRPPPAARRRPPTRATPHRTSPSRATGTVSGTRRTTEQCMAVGRGPPPERAPTSRNPAITSSTCDSAPTARSSCRGTSGPESRSALSTRRPGRPVSSARHRTAWTPARCAHIGPSPPLSYPPSPTGTHLGSSPVRRTLASSRPTRPPWPPRPPSPAPRYAPGRPTSLRPRGQGVAGGDEILEMSVGAVEQMEEGEQSARAAVVAGGGGGVRSGPCPRPPSTVRAARHDRWRAREKGSFPSSRRPANAVSSAASRGL